MDREKIIEIEAKNFQKHIATKINGSDNEIEFADPKTWCYRIHFLLKGGLLIVYGDLGYAMYSWDTRGEPSKFTLETIAGMDIQYFHGKCVCAETGDRYEIWDIEYAKKQFELYIETQIENDSDRDPDSDSSYKLIDIDNIDFSDYHSFDEIFDSELNRVNKEKGCYLSYEPGTFYDLGITRDIRCDLHLLGLKLAIKQLKTRPAPQVIVKPQEVMSNGK